LPGAAELRRQARELGKVIAARGQTETFGLAAVGDDVMPPSIESIRSARRIGPDGQVVFDLIAEVIQRRVVRDGTRTFPVWGGSTIVLGPEGEIRYVIGKGAASQQRRDAQASFIASAAGARYWTVEGNAMMPVRDVVRLLHGS
jgi:hypothetical protein